MIAAITALAGVALAGIINFVTNRQNRKSEERKHLREIILKAAIENWKHMSSILLNEHRITKKKTAIPPVEAYIINLTKLSEVLMNEKLTKENVSQKLKELQEVSAVAEKEINKYSKEQG